MKDISVSARVSEDVGRQLDRLAAATNRSRSWVVGEAIRSYLAKEVQFLEAVEEGIRAYESGDVVDHSVVVEEVRNWRRER
jgi:RHH-type rel operon transcriptional repressor/antitoxin RelB